MKFIWLSILFIVGSMSAMDRAEQGEPERDDVQQGEIREDIDCSVCLGEPEEGINREVIHLSCGHQFHRGCLIPWMRNFWRQADHFLCPNCRIPIPFATIEFSNAELVVLGDVAPRLVEEFELPREVLAFEQRIGIVERVAGPILREALYIRALWGIALGRVQQSFDLFLPRWIQRFSLIGLKIVALYGVHRLARGIVPSISWTPEHAFILSSALAAQGTPIWTIASINTAVRPSLSVAGLRTPFFNDGRLVGYAALGWAIGSGVRILRRPLGLNLGFDEIIIRRLVAHQFGGVTEISREEP